MSESVFQAMGEDAETNVRWPLPARSLHFRKGNTYRALLECLAAISFLVSAIRRNRCGVEFCVCVWGGNLY